MAEEKQRKMLFVRNLPYDLTEGEFEEKFSEYGPIVQSFLIKDTKGGEDKRCRGFGYVKFAIQEDADKAIAGSNAFSNRNAVVCYSNKKPRHNRRESTKDKSQDGDDKNDAVTAQERDTKLTKTPAVTLPEPEKDEAISSIKSVVKAEDLSRSDAKRTVVIMGVTKNTNKKKIKKLCMRFGKVEKLDFPIELNERIQAHVKYESYKDAVRAFQKCRERVLSGCRLDACLLSAISRHHPRSDSETGKIILRNLSFKITEDELKKLGMPYGKVLSASLPKRNVNGKSKLRGFGFLQFSTTEEAKNAIEKMNMSSLHGRSIIVDWAVGKEEYKSTLNVKDDAGTDASSASKQNAKGKQTSKKADTADSGSDNSDSNDEVESDDADEMDSNDDEDDSNSEEEEDENDDGSSLDGDSDDEDPSNDKMDPGHSTEPRPPMKDAKEGRTVFLSNLLYETEEDTVMEELEEFGDIEYCKIVYDHEKEHSRGCCFVKFKTQESAQACLAAVNSPEGTEGIVVDGRRLNVKLAVTKGKLSEIKKDDKNSKDKDKRNLYLANEGVILPNSTEAKDVPQQDLVKRKKAWIEKKAKLKNPNFFVSKTRLSLRNLPLNIDDNTLKSAIRKCVGKKSLLIVQSKILRSKDRVDPTGKLRSLGYAFVEFESHEDALLALRTMNNNRTIFGDNRRPIVEFSVENSVALKLRADRQVRARRKQDVKAAVDPPTKNEKQADKSKSKARRERFKAKVKASKLAGNTPQQVEQSKSKDRTKAAKKPPVKSNAKSDLVRSSKSERTLKRTKTDNGEAKAQLDDHSSADNVRAVKRRKTKDKQEEASFNKLVNTYKAKLFGDKKTVSKKSNSKWYED